MFTQALIGKLSWERKAHVDGILGSVPVWPDVVSSFQDKRMWTVSCWYFLASQARNWEGEMVCAPPWAIVTKHKQRRVSRRPVPKEFEASPAVSPRRRGAGCKSMVVRILGCRRCLIHLQVIQGVWICRFPPEISLKGADFQKCFAHFPPNWGSFLLSPLNRGLLGKGRCWLQKKHQCWAL